MIYRWASEAWGRLRLPTDRRERLRRLSWIVPFAFYVPLSIGLIGYFVDLGNPPGYDAWLYREAALAALSGLDPWSVGAANAHFPGAPSTIVAFLPSVLVPPVVWQWAFVAGCTIAAMVLIRQLALSIAWLLYPPLCTGILLGQPGVVVACLLVTRLAPLAAVIKPWAGLTLLFRPRMAIVAALLGFFTVVAFPAMWMTWFERLTELSDRLRVELHGGTPLWANALGAVSLMVIWRRERDDVPWLIVSALWPYPEYHNAIVAMPTRRPVLLAGLALVPGPPAVIGYAAYLLVAPAIQRLGSFPRAVPSIGGPGPGRVT